MSGCGALDKLEAMSICGARKEEAGQWVSVDPSFFNLMLKAFDHLHELETKDLDNDYDHEQFMKQIIQVLGGNIDTHEVHNIGSHVYKSDNVMLKAAILNLESLCEIIITLHRNDNTKMLIKKRFIKSRPKCISRVEHLETVLE